MSNLPDKSANVSAGPTPRWIVVLLVLQTLGLLVALTSNGLSLPAAEAAQDRRDPISERQEQQNVLPNAAEQRQEQIRLLRQIVAELTNANGKLDQLNKHAEAAGRE